MSVQELLTNINNEDKTVAYAIEKAIPSIGPLVEAVVDRLVSGGRLFYIPVEDHACKKETIHCSAGIYLQV